MVINAENINEIIEPLNQYKHENNRWVQHVSKYTKHVSKYTTCIKVHQSTSNNLLHSIFVVFFCKEEQIQFNVVQMDRGDTPHLSGAKIKSIASAVASKLQDYEINLVGFFYEKRSFIV